MKPCFVIVLSLGVTLSALAADRSDLDYRIRKLTLQFEAMQAKPEKQIPAQQLRDAKAIILLDRTKAGFLFAYEGGSGVILAKDPRTQRWGPPAFLSANEASLGLQVGGMQSFVVILLMNTNAVRAIAQGSFKVGGEASGTAGNTTTGTEATVSSTEPLMLVYTDTQGLYGGAAIKGDSLTPDTQADITYYGQYLTMNEILFDHKVAPTQTAVDLQNKLDSFSR